VRAWLALCSDGAYRNFVRSRSLIASSGAELARLFPCPAGGREPRRGPGDKDLLLPRRCARVARACPTSGGYEPALLEMACAGALSAASRRRDQGGLHEPDPSAGPRCRARDAARLVLLIGNTLGAFDPIAEARDWRGCSGRAMRCSGRRDLRRERDGGRLHNPLNRRFAWAPLNAVGIREADGELVFEQPTMHACPACT